MADVELVIKVPEIFYEFCKAKNDVSEIQLAIKNGVLLPDGYRIDFDKIIEAGKETI